jgi:hypothetical protein
MKIRNNTKNEMFEQVVVPFWMAAKEMITPLKGH